MQRVQVATGVLCSAFSNTPAPIHISIHPKQNVVEQIVSANRQRRARSCLPYAGLPIFQISEAFTLTDELAYACLLKGSALIVRVLS